MLSQKRIYYSVIIILLAVFFGALFIFSKTNTDNKASDDKYFDASQRFYKIFNIRIPETVDFAGEQVPIDKFYVREGLDRELLVNSYWHSNTILMFKRAYRYLPFMDSILKANRIPTDFKYLAMIESGLENIVSPAGAAGFWQFMKPTGLKYGLEINNEMDERYNLEKSTIAACKYLKSSYDYFHNWTLAAASYNMGVNGLNEVLKNQKADNYYDLYLNKETQRYIYRIIALKLIYQSPVKYGFYLRYNDMYPQIPVYTVKVDSTVTNWADFAINNNSNYRILKEFNPWILKYTLTKKENKEYKILFPQPGFEKYSKLLSEIEYDDNLFNDTLKVDQIR